MFCWIGCADGSNINAASIDAFGVNTIPMYQDQLGPDGKQIPQKDAEGNHLHQMYVVAIVDGNTFPVRPVNGMNEAQLVIRSVLGNMKKEYQKAKGLDSKVEVATEADVKKVTLG